MPYIYTQLHVSLLFKYTIRLLTLVNLSLVCRSFNTGFAIMEAFSHKSYRIAENVGGRNIGEFNSLDYLEYKTLANSALHRI